MQMKTSEKWHHVKYRWKLVRIKAAPHEGWEERVARQRRRQQGWGEGKGGEGEEEENVIEKYKRKS